MHEIVGSTTDPVSQLLVAGLLVGLFVTLAMEKAHRVLVVLGAVAILWAFTYLTPYHLLPLEAAARALDLNVLLLLASMMALVGVLKHTGVFGWAVDRLLDRFGHDPAQAFAALWWFTAVASAFLDNVTTVIFVAPIALAAVRRLRAPAPLVLLPLIMAANIGGTATLIGDPPNIMIGSGAGLTFLDFAEKLTIPVLVMMTGLHWWGARRLRAAMGARADVATGEVADLLHGRITDPGLLRWMGFICLGVLVGFLTHGVTGMPSSVPALLGAAVALVVQDIRYLRVARPSEEERHHGILEVVEKEIEWPTLVFFALLFMLVGAAVETGLTATMANALRGAIEGAREGLGLDARATLLFAAMLILWVAAALSALMDNIPFVAVGIPIIGTLVGSLAGESTVLWWALSLGACLGGNATPIGASANVTTLGLAEREGVRISFGEFTATGVRVTLFNVLVSSLYLAGFVYLGATRVPFATGAVLALAVVALWRYERRQAVSLLR